MYKYNYNNIHDLLSSSRRGSQVKSDYALTIVHLIQHIMVVVQDEDVRASFLFVGDLNGYNQEWLGSTTTNHHGVAAFDLTTVSGCDQLAVGQTHACTWWIT